MHAINRAKRGAWRVVKGDDTHGEKAGKQLFVSVVSTSVVVQHFLGFLARKSQKSKGSLNGAFAPNGADSGTETDY